MGRGQVTKGLVNPLPCLGGKSKPLPWPMNPNPAFLQVWSHFNLLVLLLALLLPCCAFVWAGPCPLPSTWNHLLLPFPSDPTEESRTGLTFFVCISVALLFSVTALFTLGDFIGHDCVRYISPTGPSIPQSNVIVPTVSQMPRTRHFVGARKRLLE